MRLVKGVGLALLLALAGCAGPRSAAPVEDRRQPPSRELRLHIVSSEETLYSIAFRYEKNVGELAALNGIQQPYVIYPGQSIYLTEEAARRNSVRPLGSTPPRAGAEPVQSAASPTDSAPTRPVDQTNRVAAVALPDSVSSWSWPLTGRVTRAFGGSEPVSKGISIAGEMGAGVQASAPGVVVYSGAGLRGYGNLLIVKHSETYLTAYAHNSELLVAEGDQVHAGQTIARVGRNTEGNTELYFEVRENGKPVDPIRFLPRR